MMRRPARWLFGLAALGALVFIGVLLTRHEPLGPIPGGRLTGREAAPPGDRWTFTNRHPTIYLEVRPNHEHSVTTECFIHQEALYVPSGDGAQKRWTRYALENPQVRLKVGDGVYRGRAFRVEDPDLIEDLLESYLKKYPAAADTFSEAEKARMWFFRIDPPGPSLARPESR